MKTVRWTVFIGGTLAGGSPNKKPATKSPEAGGVWGTPQGCPTLGGGMGEPLQRVPPTKNGDEVARSRRGVSRSRFSNQSHFAIKNAGLLVL